MDKKPLKYLTDDYVPGAYDVQSLMAELPKEKKDHYQVVFDALKTIRPNRFGIKAANRVQQIVNEQIDLLYLGKKKVKEAMDEAVAQINPLLK